jgi:hypothetical protein
MGELSGIAQAMQARVAQRRMARRRAARESPECTCDTLHNQCYVVACECLRHRGEVAAP